jgi:hypothetical protein
LFEDIDLPKETAVLVVIPEQEDERELRSQLRSAAEVVFATLWDNEGAEVFKEYLQREGRKAKPAFLPFARRFTDE